MQLQKEQKREEKKRKESAGHSSAESTGSDREERGTYQSGYNNKSSDQYATKISQKPKPAVPQRPRRTQDAIKVSFQHGLETSSLPLASLVLADKLPKWSYFAHQSSKNEK